MPSLFRIPVFFRPEMVVRDASSFSPSAGKPAKAVADWQRLNLPIEVRDFDPVDAETLALAHDRAYVDDILACRLPNGFGNRKPEVAASLAYTSGAMLAAAREALANGRVACAPVSGFHHAGYAHAAGFCTFNGLLVTHCKGPARSGAWQFSTSTSTGATALTRSCKRWTLDG